MFLIKEGIKPIIVEQEGISDAASSKQELAGTN